MSPIDPAPQGTQPLERSWYLVESGLCEPGFNMALDEALLEAMPRLGRPVLRFYGWTEPAATFGYFQKYDEVERLTPLRPLVRRPTGGGIVPHDLDWTYSLAFPAGHPWHALRAKETYRRVHEWVRAAFARLGQSVDLAPLAVRALPGQCFVGCEESDVLWRGRKIAGAAQRRTRGGLLIQGSVQSPKGTGSRLEWQRAMCEAGPPGQACQWEPWSLDDPVLNRAAELVCAKYSRAEYHRTKSLLAAPMTRQEGVCGKATFELEDQTPVK